MESLTQLGMVKSDLGELAEARRLLERSVALDPAHVNALVSLGVATLRAGDPTSAQACLEQALALSPGNPYALRALGQAHLMRNDHEGSLPFLRQAADTPPGDPITLYALAQALMALDTPEHRKEADTCLTRALALGHPPDLAERLRQTHSRLARQVLRSNAAGQPRLDVVMYCASALETYASLTPADQKQLLLEVGTAGQKGLNINDPTARLQLRHLPNSKPVSALQAACLLFVGVKLLMPGEDAGFDFEREFEVARGVVGGGKGGLTPWVWKIGRRDGFALHIGWSITILSTSPDGRTIRNPEASPRVRRLSCCFNFPGRKNHPEQSSCSQMRPGASCFNFPGRKNHPEPLALTRGGTNLSPFQLPRTEEPSGTEALGAGASPVAHVSTSPDGRTIRNQPDPQALRAPLAVSTSPDGRTIRNLARARARQLMKGFNFPGRKNHPEHGHSGMSLRSIICFNFPGRKNHPELEARQGHRVIPAVSTSPDGRTIRNGRAGCQCATADVLVSTSPDGRTIRNFYPQGPGAYEQARFQLPRTEEPSGTSHRCHLGGCRVFQLPRTEEPSGTAALKKLRAACSLRTFSAQHHYGP